MEIRGYFYVINGIHTFKSSSRILVLSSLQRYDYNHNLLINRGIKLYYYIDFTHFKTIFWEKPPESPVFPYGAKYF